MPNQNFYVIRFKNGLPEKFTNKELFLKRVYDLICKGYLLELVINDYARTDLKRKFFGLPKTFNAFKEKLKENNMIFKYGNKKISKISVQQF